MATRPDRKLTYEDYVHFPDDERVELIDGEAFVVPGANTRHQTLLGELAYQVQKHLKEHGGGRVFFAPFDVVLSDFDVFQPDLVFIADKDLEVLNDKNVRGSPSWVVEVVSDPARDRRRKLKRYELFKVPEYWIVDPIADHVEVYRIDGEHYSLFDVQASPARLSPLVPSGLSVDLSELFGD